MQMMRQIGEFACNPWRTCSVLLLAGSIFYLAGCGSTQNTPSECDWHLAKQTNAVIEGAMGVRVASCLMGTSIPIQLRGIYLIDEDRTVLWISLSGAIGFEDLMNRPAFRAGEVIETKAKHCVVSDHGTHFVLSHEDGSLSVWQASEPKELWRLSPERFLNSYGDIMVDWGVGDDLFVWERSIVSVYSATSGVRKNQFSLGAESGQSRLVPMILNASNSSFIAREVGSDKVFKYDLQAQRLKELDVTAMNMHWVGLGPRVGIDGCERSEGRSMHFEAGPSRMLRYWTASKQSQQILLGSGYGTFQVTDGRGDVRPLARGQSRVEGVVSSPGGGMLAIWREFGEVAIMDLHEGRILWSVLLPGVDSHDRAVVDCTFGTSNKQLIVLTKDKLMYRIEFRSAQELYVGGRF